MYNKMDKKVYIAVIYVAVVIALYYIFYGRKKIYNVFPRTPQIGVTKEQAIALAKSYGGVLATQQEVTDLYNKKGVAICNFGWVADNDAPIMYTNEKGAMGGGCGVVGLNTYKPAVGGQMPLSAFWLKTSKKMPSKSTSDLWISTGF